MPPPEGTVVGPEGPPPDDLFTGRVSDLGHPTILDGEILACPKCGKPGRFVQYPPLGGNKPFWRCVHGYEFFMGEWGIHSHCLGFTDPFHTHGERP
jgi:hypothetical protein